MGSGFKITKLRSGQLEVNYGASRGWFKVDTMDEAKDLTLSFTERRMKELTRELAEIEKIHRNVSKGKMLKSFYFED